MNFPLSSELTQHLLNPVYELSLVQGKHHNILLSYPLSLLILRGNSGLCYGISRVDVKLCNLPLHCFVIWMKYEGLLT